MWLGERKSEVDERESETSSHLPPTMIFEAFSLMILAVILCLM